MLPTHRRQCIVVVLPNEIGLFLERPFFVSIFRFRFVVVVVIVVVVVVPLLRPVLLPLLLLPRSAGTPTASAAGAATRAGSVSSAAAATGQCPRSVCT